jgi:hypothetical protein
VLEASGKEHIKIDGLPLGRGVLDRSGMIGLKEADVKEFFDGFEPDQVGPFHFVVLWVLAGTAWTNHLCISLKCDEADHTLCFAFDTGRSRSHRVVCDVP